MVQIFSTSFFKKKKESTSRAVLPSGNYLFYVTTDPIAGGDRNSLFTSFVTFAFLTSVIRLPTLGT